MKRPRSETLPPLPPRSDDVHELCNNRAVTTCCGAYVTFHDTTLCCKQCWREIT